MPMPSYRFKTQAAQTQFRFVAAAILQIVQEYENGRNSGAATGIIKLAETITQKGTAYVGTVLPELHVPNEVLKSASVPGNYDDDNLVPENVGIGLAFGLGEVGTLTGSEGAGPNSIKGKLNLLVKLLVNAEVIKEDPDTPGQYVIVNYDNDDETELRKCALKTFEGLDVAVGEDEICVRQRTTVGNTPVSLAGSLQLKLNTLVKAAFNRMANVEFPVGSGKFYRVIYDDDDRAVLARNPLKTFGGQEISSLKNSGDINVRGKSTI